MEANWRAKLAVVRAVRLLADSESEVLGVDPEGVEADRLEHEAAPHALEPAVRIEPAVLEDVADVETLS